MRIKFKGFVLASSDLDLVAMGLMGKYGLLNKKKPFTNDGEIDEHPL